MFQQMFFYLPLTFTFPNLLLFRVALSDISESSAYLASYKRGLNLPI